MQESESVIETIARIWPELFPGAEILDRDLSIAPDRIVPFVVLDPGGRLILALVLETAGDEAALAVLDALAFVRTRSAVLAQHLGDARIRIDRPGIVWVVARRLERALVDRLRAMDARRLRAFELAELSSRRGKRVYVAELPLDAGGGDAFASRFEAPPLDALSRESRALCDLVVRRLARVDPELRESHHARGFEWRMQDQLVCSLDLHSGALEGRVPDGGAGVEITSADEVEVFLERAVRRYLALFGALASSGPTVAGSGFAEQILTPEELAAFDPAK